MRVLLVYPPISKFERYSSEIGNSGGGQIPLGVYYVASYIRNYGHEVDVIDAEANGLTASDIVSRIAGLGPDLVGISSTTVAFHRAVELAREIKKHRRNMPIALGGPHVSSNVEHAMSQECFDYGVMREGEVTFRHLLEALERRGGLDEVLGLAYRRGEELVVNPARPPVEDLDRLVSPDKSLTGTMPRSLTGAFGARGQPVTRRDDG